MKVCQNGGEPAPDSDWCGFRRGKGGGCHSDGYRWPFLAMDGRILASDHRGEAKITENPQSSSGVYKDHENGLLTR